MVAKGSKVPEGTLHTDVCSSKANGGESYILHGEDAKILTETNTITSPGPVYPRLFSLSQYVQFVSHNRLAQASKGKASQAPQARSAKSWCRVLLSIPNAWETTQRRCLRTSGGRCFVM